MAAIEHTVERQNDASDHIGDGHTGLVQAMVELLFIIFKLR